MKYSDEVMMSFYQQTGKLFYAIAAADKTERKEEFEALKKLVRSEWLDLYDTYDEFGTDRPIRSCSTGLERMSGILKRLFPN